VPTLNDPIAFTLLGLSIRWYAIFILTGIVVGIFVMRRLAAARGQDPEFVLDMTPIIVIAGILGARLYYLLLRWEDYIDDPGSALNVRLGGLTIHGALVAGSLAFIGYCWWRRERAFAWIDIVIAGVPFGQAVGRWGNWANQEAFGTPSDLPWAVTISPERRPPAYAEFSTFHPTFLYESIANLVIGAVLVWLVLRSGRIRWLREGDVVWIYLILYGLVRWIIESARTDSLTIGPWPAAYWFSAAFILVGIGMMIVRRTIWPGRLMADFNPEEEAARGVAN
jgi:phosphatidylglycerol:prolipoprotein diacylglycerol transferase